MIPAAFDALFLDARTHHHWLEMPVEDSVLRDLYDLARMPPTSANTQPMRLVFVKSAAAKARLRPAIWETNVDKVMHAPVTAVVAYDLEFFEQMPKLMPGVDVRGRLMTRPPEVLAKMAQQSGTLQGGYLILAARALGLDCGPIGGFDTALVDETFMAGTAWKSNFLLNLGYADHAQLVPRRPRLDFEDACRIV